MRELNLYFFPSLTSQQCESVASNVKVCYTRRVRVGSPGQTCTNIQQPHRCFQIFWLIRRPQESVISCCWLTSLSVNVGTTSLMFFWFLWAFLTHHYRKITGVNGFHNACSPSHCHHPMILFVTAFPGMSLLQYVCYGCIDFHRIWFHLQRPTVACGSHCWTEKFNKIKNLQKKKKVFKGVPRENWTTIRPIADIWSDHQARLEWKSWYVCIQKLDFNYSLAVMINYRIRRNQRDGSVINVCKIDSGRSIEVLYFTTLCSCHFQYKGLCEDVCLDFAVCFFP